MEEFNNINWRDNLLEDDSAFITQSDYDNSYTKAYLNNTLNINSEAAQLLKYKKTCSQAQHVPGFKYYMRGKKKSQFNTKQHQQFIEAIKIMQSGKTALNKFDQGYCQLYNNCRQAIAKENTAFLEFAKLNWEVRPTTMKEELFNYACKERSEKLLKIQQLPQYYEAVDLLPWSVMDSSIPVEIVQTANILEVGFVAQFKPPVSAFTLNLNQLPEDSEPKVHSKCPIYSDENILEYFNTGGADVAISISALKKLLNYTNTNKLWTIPIQIKKVQVTTPENTTKFVKVIFFGKSLLKQDSNKLIMNERCHKLLIRSNLCCVKSLQFRCPDKPTIAQETIDEGKDKDELITNATYKLWVLQQQMDATSRMDKNRNMKVFKMLVRSKVDACIETEHGPQGVIVVPKLEYQLKYGGSCMTDDEIVNQWVDLFFRPNSFMHRVRVHFSTSEVVQLEPVTSQKLSLEATQRNIRLQQGFGVLYRLLIALDTHPEGNYLLRHEPKQGGYVGLFKETNKKIDVFDLHKEYMDNAKIDHTFCKEWSPIDVNIVLPIYEKFGHCPGLFTPCAVKATPRFQQGAKGKHKKKKATKTNQTTKPQ